MNAKVLVVEDDLSSADDLLRILANLKQTVVSIVASGEEAIEEAAKKQPDIILMDILLQGHVDGIAAAQQISRQSDIPILFVTSYADATTTQKIRFTRASGLLLKPVQEDALRANMELVLARRAAADGKQNGGLPLSVLKAAGYGIILADKNGTVTFLNPQAEQITGWTAESARDRNLAEVFCVNSEPASVLKLTLGSFRQQCHNLVTRAGTQVPIEYQIVSCFENGQEGIGVVFRDVQEQLKMRDALEASRRKYKGLMDSVDGIVWEADMDRQQFSFVSKQAEAILGYPLARWAEPGFFHSLIDAEDADYLAGVWDKSINKRKGCTVEYRVRSSEGQTVWIKDSVMFVPETEGGPKLRGIMIDITKRKNAERELYDSEQRFRTLVDAAPDVIFSISGEDATILTINQAFENVTGWQAADWVGRSFVQLVEPEEIKTAMEAYRSVRSGDTVRGLEIGFLTRQGERRIGEVMCRPMGDDKDGHTLFGVIRDVTDRKRAEQQLIQSAFYDSLTGLPNRALFMDRLGQAILRSKRTNEKFAVLFIDLDRFKVINDSLGHSQGDGLLIQAAHRIRQCLRPDDTVARLGGDEFVVLLERITELNLAIQIAERIQKEILRPFTLERHEVFTSGSMGIALSSPAYERGEEILRDADIAMYRAKSSGRARYQLFDTNMHSEAMRMLQLETDLRRAIERQEFVLHYQPIFDLREDTIFCFEALLRWQHPDRGMVAPGEFIRLAEETGLIIPIGNWVLASVCAQMSKWLDLIPEDYPLSISMNISARQFSQPDFVEQVKQQLADNDVPASRLNFEITESALIENPKMEELVRQVAELGIRLQIDDFGTGYSSLAYLHRFPVEMIKIDRSFVQAIERQENKELVRTMLVLAQNLGKDAIAEGIETPEQQREVERLGYRFGQGFYLARPTEAAEALALLPARQRLSFSLPGRY